MTRKKRRNRRSSPIESCRGKWSVEVSEGLVEDLRRGGYTELLRRLQKEARELEEALNTDPSMVYSLLRTPIVVEELRLRRYRIGSYRLLFEIVVGDKCRVRFLSLDVTPRRGKIYDRLRKRKRR